MDQEFSNLTKPIYRAKWVDAWITAHFNSSNIITNINHIDIQISLLTEKLDSHGSSSWLTCSQLPIIKRPWLDPGTAKILGPVLLSDYVVTPGLAGISQNPSITS